MARCGRLKTCRRRNTSSGSIHPGSGSAPRTESRFQVGPVFGHDSAGWQCKAFVRKRSRTAPISIPSAQWNVSPVLKSSPSGKSSGSSMANHLPLIPENTRMEANGDGAAFDISASDTRTFLCRLTVTDQIEQESLDVSIWGSADGETWTKKPLLKLPQQFYRGTTKLILDLSLRQETKFIRASWELNRWGRVAPTPVFVAGLELEEIPPMSRETPTARIALATK